MRRLSSGFFALIGLVALFSLSAWADDRDSCNKFTGDDSIAACTRLIASKELQGGDLAQVYRSRALNYTLFKGDYDRAIADFTEAIRLDPNSPVAHAVRGASFVRKGDYDRALVDLNEARRLDPKNASVHNAFGVCYNAKGDHDRALSALNEAIRLNPRFLYAYKNRGVAYENQGDLNKALVDFRIALSIDPDKKQTGGQEAAEGIQRVEQKLAAIGGADWLTCSAAPNREEGIPACTRLIAANKLSNRDLAQVYVWRGVAYLRFRQEYDLGRADFDEGLAAIPLSPGPMLGAPPVISQRTIMIVRSRI